MCPYEVTFPCGISCSSYQPELVKGTSKTIPARPYKPRTRMPPLHRISPCCSRGCSQSSRVQHRHPCTTSSTSDAPCAPWHAAAHSSPTNFFRPSHRDLQHLSPLPLPPQMSTKAPATHKQPSRKGKKAWRKNVDITPVTAGLEEVREQITQGYPPSPLSGAGSILTVGQWCHR